MIYLSWDKILINTKFRKTKFQEISTSAKKTEKFGTKISYRGLQLWDVISYNINFESNLIKFPKSIPNVIITKFFKPWLS